MCPLSNRSLRRPCVRELFARPSAPAEKADVWSLGVVFWEMLTLEVPFADMPPAQLIGGEHRRAACDCRRRQPPPHRCCREALAPCPLQAALPRTRISAATVSFERPLTPHPSHPPACLPALGLGKLRLAIPAWCEPDWRALMESCWVEDPALRPSCRQLATHLERIRDMAPHC